MKMLRRHELAEEEWERIRPHLPQKSEKRGRPAKDPRILINAMLWILSTGAPWRDLPSYYGPWKTVFNTYRRWTISGVWQAVYDALLEGSTLSSPVEWTILQMDSTTCKAHQHASGGKGGRQNNALGDPEED